jgi:hypothetical protein
LVYVARGGTVYAFLAGAGLDRATEPELNWKTVTRGFGNDVLLHLATNPGNGQVLYAITLNPKTHDQAVVASRDGGTTWAPFGGK